MADYTELELKEKIITIKVKLQECVSNNDTEVAHGIADDLLCELVTLLGYDDIVEIYNDVSKWYG